MSTTTVNDIPAALLRECRASGQISDAQWDRHCAERPDLLDTSPVRDAVAPAPAAIRLTKTDTIALWHAVEDMKSLLGGMRMEPPCTPEQIEAQQARLLAAKRALRKINALRRTQ